LRPGFRGKWDGAAIADEPLITFDVDHQCVQLRRVDEVERSLSQRAIANAEDRQVQGLWANE
jgi:hypothetical protein